MSPAEVWLAVIITGLPVMSRGEWTLVILWAAFAVCIIVAAFFFGDKEGR